MRFSGRGGGGGTHTLVIYPKIPSYVLALIPTRMCTHRCPHDVCVPCHSTVCSCTLESSKSGSTPMLGGLKC